MSIEDLENFNINAKKKELINKYAPKLGFDQDAIDIFFDVLSTVDTILEKRDVRTKAREWDHVGVKVEDGKVILPKDFEEIVYEIIRDNQLYTFFLPEHLGGMGFGNLFQGPISEIIATYDISLQVMIMISLSVVEALVQYHRPNFDPILEEFGEGKRLGYVAFSEPGAGSNLEAVKSTSELVGDEYVLNGTKVWISNGGYANTGLFLAQNIVNGKREGTNVFLVTDLDGITPLRVEEKSGLHVSPTAQLLFENVTVPKENVIAEVGDGYRKVLERLMGMRVGVSFQGIAAAKRLFQEAFDYAKTREQFKRPIIEFPIIENKLREMMRTIPRMEEYGYRAAYTLDRYNKGWVPADVGAGGKEGPEKQAASMVPGAVRGGLAHHFVSSAKIYTSEVVNQMAYDATQIFGGNGFVAEYEVNKVMRDVRVLAIYEGTSEIHNQILHKTQKAVAMIPNFKRLSESFDGTTVYERMMFERFPDLKNLI